jgi:hypothetical protein
MSKRTLELVTARKSVTTIQVNNAHSPRTQKQKKAPQEILRSFAFCVGDEGLEPPTPSV